MSRKSAEILSKSFFMNKVAFITILVSFAFSSLIVAQKNPKSINIIPQPEHVKISEGQFKVTPKTKLIVSAKAVEVGNYFNDFLFKSADFQLSVNERTDNNLPKSGFILLELIQEDSSLGKEGYELKVSNDKIIITALETAGLFYGVQSIRQLLPPQIESPKPVKNIEWKVPAVEIKDKPRFAWRGMHLDVGRYMFPVSFIKKYIDLMALHKMNVFHWHLTEDQGWRIEIKKYPKLTEVGAYRKASPLLTDRNTLDKKPYGGYYTQEEIKEIVDYAAKRFVTIVPEIEMPGHSMAALASYPELGCTGGPYEVRSHWGIEKNVYCAGNEKVYGFLNDVLTEVMELFPGQYIHVGGDECPTDRWKECNNCQSLLHKEGLDDEHKLQTYFMKRIQKLLAQNGKTMVGWEEIMNPDTVSNTVLMAWRTKNNIGYHGAKLGYKVVQTPNRYCYFNKSYTKYMENEPPARPGNITIESVYNYNPIPEGLAPEFHENIIGAQACLWTEYINTPEIAEYMTYPRASALSEVLWSSPDSTDYSDFIQRLPHLLERLNLLNVNYRPIKND